MSTQTCRARAPAHKQARAVRASDGRYSESRPDVSEPDAIISESRPDVSEPEAIIGESRPDVANYQYRRYF